jgi:VIT1/CCC1 family predicted Fe2+/Mn2+ transporter
LTKEETYKTNIPADLIGTIQADWSLEMDGVDMYQALADRERIPESRKIFQSLSELERSHADRWAKHLQKLGAGVPASNSGQAHATRVADTPGGMQAIIAAILKTMAAEKLNLNEEALANPIQSAVTGLISTAIGAFVPIIPFFFVSGIPAVIAAKSLVTVRSWWSSGAEMTLVGAVECVVTYIIGIALGDIGA